MSRSLEERVIDRLRTMAPRELGKFGEHLWENIFQAAGLYYISLYKHTEKGAPMQGGPEKTILPDWEVSSHRFAFYGDAKGKRHPIEYRNARELRHGIESRSFTHYQAISERARKHCFLAVFECFKDVKNEEWSGSLLLQTLVALGEPAPGFSWMRNTVFWPRDSFKELAVLTPVEVYKIRKGKDDAPSFREQLWEFFEVNNSIPVQGRLL